MPHSHDHTEARPLADTGAAGVRASKVSLVGLGITAALQAVLVVVTGSVALLSDTLHNLTDALTAIPLWIAFALGRRASSRRFTFGLGRAEDLAGLVIVVAIAASAGGVAWESLRRLFDPQALDHVPWVIAAGFIGAAGNELVARYRIRVGRRISSAALIADGHHARSDALTSLQHVVLTLRGPRSSSRERRIYGYFYRGHTRPPCTSGGPVDRRPDPRDPELLKASCVPRSEPSNTSNPFVPSIRADRMSTRLPQHLVSLIAAISLALAACNVATDAVDDGLPADIENGAQVFAANCAACHGSGANGTVLGPPLLDDVYSSSHHSDAAFEVAIRVGAAQHHWKFGPMPRQHGLTAGGIRDVIAFVRQLQLDAGID